MEELAPLVELAIRILVIVYLATQAQTVEIVISTFLNSHKNYALKNNTI